ncbi:MAG: NAD-dependent epimerase/dehydratase family protein [Thermoanaerobaculia bacterium]
MTGASGFLGRAVVARLGAGGWSVDAVSTQPDSGKTPTRDITWHRADLLRPGAVEELIAGSEAGHLIHLAWAPNRGIYWSPENFGWVTASTNLFSRFFEHGGQRAVAVGSSAEYDWRAGICRERTTRLGGGAVYGACKRALGELFAGLCEQYGGPEAEPGSPSGAWARIFFLYGPHEPEDRLVPAVTRSLLEGRAAYCSEGRQVRDYLFVEDAADALVRVLDSDLSGPVNIASGEGIRVRDLVRRIADRTGGAELVEWGVPDGHPFVVADTTRLRNELGWRPAIGLDEGMDRTVSWWRERLATESQSS